METAVSHMLTRWHVMFYIDYFIIQGGVELAP